MIFHKKMCLLQTLLLSVIMKKDEGEVLSKIFHLYALSDADRAELHLILHNNTFSRLRSTAAVILHENFLQSFCVNEWEFGWKDTEFEALEIKRNAYTLAEQLSGLNLYEALSTAAAQSDELTISLALLYFLNKEKSEHYLPLLRRALAHGNAEAAIVLMQLEKTHKETLYERLCTNKELLLINDSTLTWLADYYGFENVKGGRKDD